MSAATLRELLADAVRHLAEVSDSPRLDAELLLAAALDRPRSYLHAWPERVPEPEQYSRLPPGWNAAGPASRQPTSLAVGNSGRWNWTSPWTR